MDGKLYGDVLRAISQYWIGQLKPVDLSVLLFIVNRTVRYHKPREVITIRQMMEGVVHNERLIQSPILATRPTLIQSYNRLEARGLVRRRIVEIRKYVEANEFEVDCKRILKGLDTMGKLKIPRRLKNFTDPGKEILPTPVKKLDSKVVEGKLENRSSRVPATSAGSLGDKITEAKRRVRYKQKEKAAGIDQRISMQGVVAYWKESMLRAHPRAGVPNFTRKDYGVFKACYKSVKLPIPLSKFMDWAIDDWAQIKQRKLSWATGLPDSPDLFWFGKLLSHFVKAYADIQVRRDHHAQPVTKGKAKPDSQEVADLKRKLADETARRKLAEKQRRVSGTGAASTKKGWDGDESVLEQEVPDEW